MVQLFSTSPVNKAGMPAVDIYPWNCDVKALAENYNHVKTIYYIRHAEGTHNVNMKYRDRINLDARLTEKGKGQCRELASRIQSANTEKNPELLQLREQVQLLVTSPLTRCMQTALLSLEPILSSSSDADAPSPVKVLAHEGIRETVNYNCDRRRSLADLKTEFGSIVDFSLVEHDEDPIWGHYEATLGSDMDYTSHRESAQVYVVAERARSFFTDFLSTRPEQHICLCSHRAFSRVLWNFGLGYATNVPQSLDKRPSGKDENIPVVRYMGDEDFEAQLRADYDNCELRAMVIAF